jgi:hypothetical protein
MGGLIKIPLGLEKATQSMIFSQFCSRLIGDNSVMEQRRIFRFVDILKATDPTEQTYCTYYVWY